MSIAHSYSYSRAHSPTFLSLHLRHSSFSNPFRRFTYVTAHSPTLPLLYLRHSSFSNPSFVSPTSQDFHLRHLASRPWVKDDMKLRGRTERGECCGMKFWKWENPEKISKISSLPTAIVSRHSNSGSQCGETRGLKQTITS